MTQHREDQPLSQDALDNLADSIRGTQDAGQSPVGHAGHSGVPEDVRERPIEGVSAPIDPTVDPENVEIPSSPKQLDLHPDERAHPTLMPPVTQPEGPKKSRRIIAGSAAAVVFAAVLGGYFGTKGRGGDHTADVTSPNTTPTPTATTSESPQPTQSTSPSPENNGGDLATKVLDPSITPIKAEGQPTFNDQASVIADHVKYDSVARLVDGKALQAAQNSDNPAVQSFMQNYVTSEYNMAQATADPTLVGQMYDNYVLQSQFYGEAQGFKNPDTFDYVGKLPYATHKDIEDAYMNGGDVTELFRKLYNGHVSYLAYGALDTELTAGNTDPSLPNRLADWALSTDDVLNTGATTLYRNNLREALLQVMHSHVAAYKKNPDAYQGLADQFSPQKVTDAKILAVSRQIIGEQFPTNGQAAPGPDITTMVVKLTTTQLQKSNTAPNEQYLMGALIPVPDGSKGNNEHLQFVILDSAQ